MEQTELKRIKRILLTFIIGFVLCTGYLITNASTKVERIEKPQIEIVDTVKVDTISIKNRLQQDIIVEVTKYIRKQSPKAHQYIPKYLVQSGLTHNIDICFMMAQTQIETNYGTTGMGREISKRSLFGVVSKRYGDYESAINDYCRILNKSYLGRGKTEKHLMTKYVTHGGARYASALNYEAELSKAYKGIVNNTNIQKLQEEWKNL